MILGLTILSGVSTIFFFFNYFFFTNFFSCSRTVPMAQPVYPLNSKTPKKSSPKDKSGHVRVSDAAMSK